MVTFTGLAGETYDRAANQDRYVKGKQGGLNERLKTRFET